MKAIGDHGHAFGIGQWQGPRQKDFKALFGRDIRQSTIEEQLAFFNYELTQGAQQKAGKRLRGAGGAYEAGDIVSRYDERPAAVEEAARNRGKLAASIFGQGAPAALASAAPASPGAAGATGKVDVTVERERGGRRQGACLIHRQRNPPKIDSTGVGRGNGGV